MVSSSVCIATSISDTGRKGERGMTQMDIFSYLYFDYKITKPIRLIELFAGVGSQAMALRDLGANFTHHRVVEIDPFAMKSYNAIHGTSFEPMDITTVTAADLGITDKDKYEYIITYSFPCQDLSLAGKGKGMEKGSGTRSSLLWKVERILFELKERNALPQVLLMENVPDVIGTKNYPHFMKWYASLERMGYQSYYKLLNAKDYGVPQSRNRCFMVSILGNYSYTFPNPIPLEKRLWDVLESEVDERYYLSDKAIAYLFDDKDRGGMVRAKRVKLKNKDSILADTVTTMQHGYSPFDNFIIHSNGFNKRIRKFTPFECWRLMDFTDEDFYKAQAVNSNTQLYKQAGNGIVRAVLMAVFKEMLGKE